jgi:hypothetical protein
MTRLRRVTKMRERRVRRVTKMRVTKMRVTKMRVMLRWTCEEMIMYVFLNNEWVLRISTW